MSGYSHGLRMRQRHSGPSWHSVIDRELVVELQQVHEQLTAQDRKISDIETVLMGPLPARDNGLRGDMKVMSAKLDAAIAFANDLWNNRRPKECIGVDALEVYKVAHAQAHITDIDMKKLALDADKARRDSRTTLLVAVASPFIMVLGSIALKLVK